MTISGKTCVITGASRGIGLEWAKNLLQQGNTVVATARDPSSAAGLSELSQQYGDKLLTTSLETSSEQGIAEWAAQLKGKLTHIDVLINNAGVIKETFEDDLAKLSSSSLAETMAVNVYGPMLVVQQLLKQGLLGGDAPSLIAYTSSYLGSMGDFVFPHAKVYAYRASKAALNMLVVTSVLELTDRNITSVILHPGYVATDMNADHTGTISVAESLAGMLKVLQDGRPLHGRFYNYTGEELAF